MARLKYNYYLSTPVHVNGHVLHISDALSVIKTNIISDIFKSR